MSGLERIELRGDGVKLIGDAAGPENGPILLFLHGSGQTRQSWGKAVELAAKQGFRAITLDMRGHGDSDWAPDNHYVIYDFCDDLKAILTQLPAAPIVVGASLGGMVSMMVAGQNPDALAGLVLVDITLQIEVEGAMEVLDFMKSASDGFASLDEAADAVAAYLPHRTRPKSTKGLEKNLRLRNGRWYWHWDPGFLSMGPNQAEAQNLPEVLNQSAAALTIPTLLIKGGKSRIVTDEGAKDFLARVPHAEFVDIDGAHHMVAGDANDTFNQAVLKFIRKITK